LHHQKILTLINMKIEIDTKQKTIRILEVISFEELVTELDKMLGLDEQKNYKVIPYTDPYSFPYVPYNPITTYGHGGTSIPNPYPTFTTFDPVTNIVNNENIKSAQ